MSAAGIAIGVLMAWAASGVRSLLYEVIATDAAVFAAAAGLAAVTLAGYACRRARVARAAGDGAPGGVTSHARS